MPQIKCPKCGRVRLVVEGKRKNCRKCGTPLSTIRPKVKPPEKVTADMLREKYPEQISQIINDAKAAVVREEIGDLTAEILLEQYPLLVDELTTAAREDTKKEVLDELKKKQAEAESKKSKRAAKSKKS